MKGKQKQSFQFRTTLSSVKGKFISTVIFLPPEIVEALPEGRLRMKGTFNGAPVALGVQNMKGGRKYFSVSAPLRKAAGVRAGDMVDVRFKLVDPDELEVPEELAAVLEQDTAGKGAWDTLTRGYQRSIIHYITSVKNIDSRIKRAIELVEKAKAGLLTVQKRKGNKERGPEKKITGDD